MENPDIAQHPEDPGMHVMPHSHHGKQERNCQALPSESALPEGLS